MPVSSFQSSHDVTITIGSAGSTSGIATHRKKWSSVEAGPSPGAHWRGWAGWFVGEAEAAVVEARRDVGDHGDAVVGDVAVDAEQERRSSATMLVVPG